MKGRVYKFSLFRTFNFQTVTGFVRKRSPKFLGGFGFRTRRDLDRRNQTQKTPLNYGTRFALIFWLLLCPASPFFQILHLLLVLFFGAFVFPSFRRTMLVFFLLLHQTLKRKHSGVAFSSIFLCCCCSSSYLSSFLASFLSTHFSDILSQTLVTFILGLSGFSVVDVLISLVFFFSPSLAGWFFFSSSCVWCFGFRLWQIGPFSLQFWCFYNGSYYVWYTAAVSCTFRDTFCAFFPKALVLNPSLFLVYSFSLLFLILSMSRFHVSFLAFLNPFWDDILVVLLLLNLCCPFPFFVSASFLETKFLTAPSPIQLTFSFGCLALLLSIFELLSFLAWCFLLCLFFLLVFVWFSYGCCFHLSFDFWCFSSLFFFLLVFVRFLLRLLFWLHFPCGSGVFWGVSAIPIWVRMFC